VKPLLLLVLLLACATFTGPQARFATDQELREFCATRPKVFCPDCVKAGESSTVYMTNLQVYEPAQGDVYWNDAGVMAYRYGESSWLAWFECSRGHRFAKRIPK